MKKMRTIGAIVCAVMLAVCIVMMPLTAFAKTVTYHVCVEHADGTYDFHDITAEQTGGYAVDLQTESSSQFHLISSLRDYRYMETQMNGATTLFVYYVGIAEKDTDLYAQFFCRRFVNGEYVLSYMRYKNLITDQIINGNIIIEDTVDHFPVHD